MSSPQSAGPGGYRYESPQSRALGSITPESYDYRDQGKLLGKLTNDVSYMAAYMRKMQQGIDKANENIIQQIQSLIEDIITTIGGHGDTGFDFGDLKYILKMFGAFIGYDGSPDNIPFDFFQVAWHFFSVYILHADNLKDFINNLIDTAIATLLDIFGQVPILGQALEQLAVFISDLRDDLEIIGKQVNAMFSAFGILVNDLVGWQQWWALAKEAIDLINDFFAPFFSLVSEDRNAIKGWIASWNNPYLVALRDTIDKFTAVIKSLGLAEKTVEGIASFFGGIANFLIDVDANGGIPAGWILDAITVNLIDNPGLDGGATNWNLNPGTDANFNPTWSGSDGHANNGCISLSGTGKSWAQSNFVHTLATQRINAFAYYKKLTSDVNTVQLSITEYDDNFIWLRDGVAKTSVSTSSGTGNWTRIDIDANYKVSNDAYYIKLVPYVDNGPNNGTVLFDDFGLHKQGVLSGLLVPFFQDLLEALFNGLGGRGVGTHSIEDVQGILETLFGGGLTVLSSIVDQILNVIPNLASGLGGLTGLGSAFTDLISHIGITGALGSGSPNRASVTSIPLLFGLFSGGKLLASLIPSLDASIIGTGKFLASLIAGLFGGANLGAELATMLGGGLTAFSSIIDQIIAKFPFKYTSLASGLTGLGSIFTDLVSHVGITGNLGSGSPVKAAITAIPLLSALFSGGTILNALIAGLDASKITTGTLLASLIPSLTSSWASLGRSIDGSILSGIGSIASSLLGNISLGGVPGSIQTLLQSIPDSIYQAIFGGSGTGYSASSVKVALLNIPGRNIVSTILASIVPSFDASKIATGQFFMNLIPSLTSAWTGTISTQRVEYGSNTSFSSGTQTRGVGSGFQSTGDSLTVTIGPSKKALVTISALISNGSAGQGAVASWGASGANAVSPDWDHAISVNNGNTTLGESVTCSWSAIWDFTYAGSTTFTMYFANPSSVGTAYCSNRRVSVLPL